MSSVERAGRAGPRHLRARPGFRRDIEGLRAVAVLAVVLYHAKVGALSGGFVGVDVFYVISGFLITDLLWRELERTGRVSLAGFYARRARRLLPAAMLVLAVTMIASLELLPPLQVRSVWKDGLASALYVANYRFAAAKTNYLATTAPSPFQHFWSLGVEEQFYLVWPLLLVTAALVWWRRRPSRTGAMVGLGAVSVGSLALSLWLTRVDEPLAFFSLPTRAWELGLGGLIALGAPFLRRSPTLLAAVVGWAGLAAILVACVSFGASTAYPGTAALLPVLGAAGVVASGLAAPPAGPVLLLGRVGVRAVGRISYSWYLWHYPVLVLAPYAVGHSLSVWDNVGLAAGSGLLAVVTYRWVEVPARRSSWLAARPARSLFTGATLSALGVVVCLAVAGAIPSVAGHGQAPVAAIRLPTSTTAPAGPAGRGATHAAAVSPAVAAYRAAQSQVALAVARSAGVEDVPANLDPSLADASASEAAPMVDGCLLSFTQSNVPPCLFGDTTATRSIVLFGDSHAAMWFPAVDAYANAHHYRLYVWTKAACPPVAVTLFSPVLDRTWTECSDWRTNVLAAAASLHPALAVLGIAPNYDSAYDVVQDSPAWDEGVGTVVSALRSDGAHVLVMGSVPAPSTVVPDCASAHLTDLSACDFSPVGRRVNGGGLVGIQTTGVAGEAAAVRRAGGSYADVRPWFCTATVCDAVVDNLLVYRDDSHITVPYATYLAPLVADQMTAALTGGPTP